MSRNLGVFAASSLLPGVFRIVQKALTINQLAHGRLYRSLG